MAKFVFNDGTEFEFEKDDAPVLGCMIGVYGAAINAMVTGDSSRLVTMIMQIEMTHKSNTDHLVKFGEQLLLKEVMKETGKSEDEVKAMCKEHAKANPKSPASKVKEMFNE